MRAHRLTITLATLGAVAVATTVGIAAYGDGPPGSPRYVSSVPFRAGEDGYDTFRIPSAVLTREGTLIAFAEGRVGGAGDSGHIDVVRKRSTDGGRTWGPLGLVAAGDGNTRGNPAPVVDPGTGRIVLLSSYNSGEVTEARIMTGAATAEQSRRVFVQSSEDDGRTFSAPREITAEVKKPDWRWYATGPGHAVALTTGPHKGRLVVPANHSAAPPSGSSDTGREAKYYGAHAVYSDDGGLHWNIGYVDGGYEGLTNSNESSVAQLPDGRLYFSARDQKGSSAGNRLGAYSADGGRTLDAPYRAQSALHDVPLVQGSLLQTTGRKGAPLLFAGPSVPTARKAMAIWRSTEGGSGFTKVTSVSELPAAYSDLVQPDSAMVGLFYETGAAGPYERIEYRGIPLGDLMANEE